jgi:hypothetical protein
MNGEPCAVTAAGSRSFVRVGHCATHFGGPAVRGIRTVAAALHSWLRRGHQPHRRRRSVGGPVRNVGFRQHAHVLPRRWHGDAHGYRGARLRVERGEQRVVGESQPDGGPGQRLDSRIGRVELRDLVANGAARRERGSDRAAAARGTPAPAAATARADLARASCAGTGSGTSSCSRAVARAVARTRAFTLTCAGTRTDASAASESVPGASSSRSFGLLVRAEPQLGVVRRAGRTGRRAGTHAVGL